MATKKAKRSQFMTFLNTGSASSATWSRMGLGITGQTVEYNPQTETTQYIDKDSATTELNGYQVNLPTTQIAYVGDPVFDFVDNLRKTRAVGSDAATEILMVNAYEEAQTGAYSAEKCEAVIAVNSHGGENTLSISYTVYINGDPVEGKFNPSSKTFTANGAA